MKRLITSSIILLLTTPFANANHHRNYHNARVIEVTPHYEYVTMRRAPNVCSTSNQSYNATLIGSVVGGSIGHATSNKRHKVIGTIAGAIIGSAIGHQIDNPHSQYKNCSYHPRTQPRTKQRVLKGYEVSYQVKNRIHQTFSHKKPTKYIRIYH